MQRMGLEKKVLLGGGVGNGNGKPKALSPPPVPGDRSPARQLRAAESPTAAAPVASAGEVQFNLSAGKVARSPGHAHARQATLARPTRSA
jgi:hypothetical protein